MLASVEEVDNLDCAGKMLIGEIPDPDRAIGDDHFLFRPAPATPPSFGIDAQTKLFGGFDRGDVGCRAIIADRPALFIGSGLSENAAEFHFSRVCQLSLAFARATFDFCFPYRHTSTVHLDVKDRHRGSANYWQFQLLGAMDHILFARGNIFANRFRLSLDSLSGDFQIR
jgi:hypothetical protein